MPNQLYARQQSKFLEFVDRRNPKSDHHVFSQKNLFIFLSKSGLVLFIIIVSLWVLGTNYQNNLIRGLAFFLVSLLVLTIMHTFLTMTQLKISLSGCSEVFAGQQLHLRFSVANKTRRWRESIEFTWQDDMEQSYFFAFEPHSDTEINIPYFVSKRGKVCLPRIRVQTHFPLGVIRCWTWLNWDIELNAFPKPINIPLGRSLVSDEKGDGLHPVAGGEDFNGLRTYIPGDNLRKVAWKVLAKGQGLHVKDFSQSVSQENWLDFDGLAMEDYEQRLSVLCFWILHFYQEEKAYGLNLPTCRIDPDSGHAHRLRCLNALAEFSQ